jgi:hypothetical protein
MTKRHKAHWAAHTEEKAPKQHHEALAVQVITPGRAPAEGAAIDIESPSHERWAQDTADRAPVEGPVIDTPSVKPSGKR